MPRLARFNVNVVAVGVEAGPNAEEFMREGYWGGRLMVDDGEALYRALGFKNLGISRGWGIFDKRVLKAKKDADQAGVAFNFKGKGGFICAGTLVVAKGGELLYLFRQEHYGHHPNLQTLLDAVRRDPHIRGLELKMEEEKRRSEEKATAAASAVAAVLANPSAFPVESSTFVHPVDFSSFGEAQDSQHAQEVAGSGGGTAVQDLGAPELATQDFGFVGPCTDSAVFAQSTDHSHITSTDPVAFAQCTDYSHITSADPGSMPAFDDDNWKVIEFDEQEDVPDCTGDDNPCA